MFSSRAFDNRLVNVPEQSIPPFLEEPKSIKDSVINNSRLDGRDQVTPRLLFIKTGLVDKAHGSAYLEQGKIKISCAVYGPRPVVKAGAVISATTGNLECEFSFSSFSSSWRTVKQRDTEEKEISQILTQALGPSICLHMFPKSSIDVYVTVIESDGRLATIAAAIKCATIALVDASIDMFDVVTCVSASLFNNSWVIDCTQAEENEEDSSILLSYMVSSQEITNVIQTGKTSIELSQNGLNLCVDVGSKIYQAMCQYLSKSL
ncbi:hypothetical protein BB561_003084 [Smittium simulii]|uniref:Uncharacterized protein n=1 Tax=Smittium simulii TaxID=133385 RepID=A0A2T9YN12_9FUNG|nr:hypothetical protein BB561_003084 [Smittium simulii]